VIWRTVLWYPELVSHVFSVCTPYTAPSPMFISTEDMVKGPAPQFGYQLQLASGEVEKKITSREGIRQFLRGMYGGRGPNREVMFSPFKGVLYEELPKIGPSPIITEKVCDPLVCTTLKIAKADVLIRKSTTT
jgi:soluble epoxide hydrolase/lipid-phosphate phosphatase